MKAAAEALISNNPYGQRIVFHVDNQATIKNLDTTDITKKTCKDTRDSLNALGKENTVVLEWVKAHVGILGKEEADKFAKAGGNYTAVLGTRATADSGKEECDRTEAVQVAPQKKSSRRGNRGF
jgi:ribonuclease HI